MKIKKQTFVHKGIDNRKCVLYNKDSRFEILRFHRNEKRIQPVSISSGVGAPTPDTSCIPRLLTNI